MNVNLKFWKDKPDQSDTGHNPPQGSSKKLTGKKNTRESIGNNNLQGHPSQPGYNQGGPQGGNNGGHNGYTEPPVVRQPLHQQPCPCDGCKIVSDAKNHTGFLRNTYQFINDLEDRVENLMRHYEEERLLIRGEVWTHLTNHSVFSPS